MSDSPTNPGIEREQRISQEGLDRLEKHLKSGSKISKIVLQQWIKRYGEPARALLLEYGISVDKP